MGELENEMHQHRRELKNADKTRSVMATAIALLEL